MLMVDDLRAGDAAGVIDGLGNRVALHQFRAIDRRRRQAEAVAVMPDEGPGARHEVRAVDHHDWDFRDRGMRGRGGRGVLAVDANEDIAGVRAPHADRRLEARPREPRVNLADEPDAVLPDVALVCLLDEQLLRVDPLELRQPLADDAGLNPPQRLA